MHCVDLGESFPTRIYLQKSASIQPRTSPPKICKNFRKMHFRRCIFKKCIFEKCILLEFQMRAQPGCAFAFTGYSDAVSPGAKGQSGSRCGGPRAFMASSNLLFAHSLADEVRPLKVKFQQIFNCTSAEVQEIR